MKPANNTIAELLKWAVGQLEPVIETASIDAHLLMEKVINQNKLYMIMNKNDLLSSDQVAVFTDFVARRVLGEPAQYIVESQEFMGLEFYVNKHVLIPRSDTEPLVEELIHLARDIKRTDGPLRILDIGTGSGAITLSLANYIEDVFVTSVDISMDAIGVAKINAESIDVKDKVEFINSDLFEALVEDKYYDEFDIIVSNPPYIPSGDIPDLQVEVSVHEPRLALDGGLSGYDLYKRIIDDGYKYLKDGGVLAFEVGYNQAEEIKKMLRASNYDKIRFVNDLSGIQRIVIGQLVKS